MRPLRIAIIGFGKIARDQHLPAIAGIDRFALAATVGSRAPDLPPDHPDVRSFARTPEMLEAMAGQLDAAVIATPPAVRYDIARMCIAAGLHLMLEKPPTMTLGEIADLAGRAEAAGLSLFTTWHAQHNPAVDSAAEALAGQRLRAMRIDWREDVRKWHPGQRWIWEAGGFGVFDPGINALSVACRIVPDALFVREAELFVPDNLQMPIAARLRLASPAADGVIAADFDWRETASERWTIEAETAEGRRIELSEGGAVLTVDGAERVRAPRDEYPRLYRLFLDLVDERRSRVDVAPLRLTADAFLIGRRISVEGFRD